MQQISGEEFLRGYFGDDWQRSWVCNHGRWEGGFAGDKLHKLSRMTGCYFTPTLLKPGTTARREDSFEAVHVVVLDDIGDHPTSSKFPEAEFIEEMNNGLNVTHLIETSRKNFQAGFKLSPPVTDPLLWATFREGLKASPRWGRAADGTGLNHYYRLPFGLSGKNGFPTRIVRWDPEETYTIYELADWFGVDLSPEAIARTKAPSKSLGGIAAGEEADDPIYRVFDEKGMVLSAPKKDGWIDVTCPWEAEHTRGAAGGTAYHPKGAFRCHHAHCNNRGIWALSNKLFDDQDYAPIYRPLVFPALPEEETDDRLRKIQVAYDDIVQHGLLSQLRLARKNFDEYEHQEGFQAIALDPANAKSRTPVPPMIIRGFVRGLVTLFAARPGAGKSSLSLSLALAIAHVQPSLVGQSKIDWVGDIVIVSNEDGVSEVARRIDAIEAHFGLDPKDRKHQIHIVPGPGVTLLEKSPKGGVLPKCKDLLLYLIEIRKKRDIALVVLDTLSSMVSGVNENDNQDMQRVMDFLTHLSRASFASLVAIHHVSKNSASSNTPDMYAMRGASSVAGAARSAFQLSEPFPLDLKKFGWSEAAAKSYVRLDNTKSSYDAKTSGPFQWFKWETQDVDVFDPRTPSVTFQRPVGLLVPVSLTPVDQDAQKLREKFKQLEDVVADGSTIRVNHRADVPGSVSITDLWGPGAERVLDKLEEMGLVRRVRSRTATRNSAEMVEIVSNDEEIEAPV